MDILNLMLSSMTLENAASIEEVNASELEEENRFYMTTITT